MGDHKARVGKSFAFSPCIILCSEEFNILAIRQGEHDNQSAGNSRDSEKGAVGLKEMIRIGGEQLGW